MIALAICPVKGEVHRAFQADVIKREEVDQRVSEILARMSARGVIIGRPQVIRSGQEMALTIAAPVMNGDEIVAAVVAVVSFQEVFKAVHVNGVPLYQDKAFFDWAANHGLDRNRVAEVYASFTVNSKFNRAKAQANAYNIQSVPTMVVDGKFVTGRVDVTPSRITAPAASETSSACSITVSPSDRQ